MAGTAATVAVTPQLDLFDDWHFHEPRIKRPRVTNSCEKPPLMAPSVGNERDCCVLPRWRTSSPMDEELGQLCSYSTVEAAHEELICLCPKPGMSSSHAAVRNGVVVVRGSHVSPASAPLPVSRRQVCMRYVGPVFAMALLIATLWSSVSWQFPHPKAQPGVRNITTHPLGLRSSSRLSGILSRTRSLPVLPEFSVEPLELQLDAQAERIMDIFCRGPILHAVQMAGVFPDSKHFVDMPLKPNTSVYNVILDFHERRLAMTDYHQQVDGDDDLPHDVQLRAFLDDHFDPPGSDFVAITPFDYQEHVTPPLIAGIQDAEYREWAMHLHHLWRHLGRMPQTFKTSTILLAKPFADPQLSQQQNVLIVPGGRFRESYYWDSYWIVQGLLASNMATTARGVVNNLLAYVAEFGFVPNGGRIYYLTRSQPPMLSDMVKLVASTGHKNASCVEYDEAYLAAAVPILDQEYSFWMQRGPGGHAVAIELPGDGSNGNRKMSYVLNRFVSNANHARPESYREDMDIAADIFGETVIHDDSGRASAVEADKAKYYSDVIAAAESGWDFSSRWTRDPLDMRTMQTSTIVPVDLNAVMFRMERNMRAFHEYLGNPRRAKYYETQAEARREAMDAVLWNETLGAWKDYSMETSKHSPVVSISDYSPLWAKAFDPDNEDQLRRVVKSLRESGLLQVGGVLTTNTFTGQQWDAPNAWPPEQDIVIEGLLAANLPESHELARELAKTWVHTSLTAWRDTGLMFEKYNATEVGGLGVGGEYFPQFGFGWTNGVILKLLTIHQNLLLP